MHYIRLLRPPQLSRIPGALQLDLLLTITTDLGDAFLACDDPLQLQAIVVVKGKISTTSHVLLPKQGHLTWNASDRVSKPAFDIPKAVLQALVSKTAVEICILPKDEKLAATSIASILSSTGHAGLGQVMPAWATLSVSQKDMESLRRRIAVDDRNSQYVEVEEEIGESIARHIWDAGVVSMCAIMATFTNPSVQSSKHDCMVSMRDVLSRGPNILELGCGVGILGIGLAQVLSHNNSLSTTLLMTDLEEAQERAESNMALLSKRTSKDSVKVLYENLDWEDGRIGRFSETMQAKAWDLVMLSDCTYNVDMLPALVETLSAIHASNCNAQSSATTRVFMATKPRHDSERALFGLLDKHGWAMTQKQVLSLPVLGADDQTVEMYIFEKK